MTEENTAMTKKHDSLVRALTEALDSKPYVKQISTCQEYELGETDVLTEQDFGWVYYEVKSNHHKAALDRAKNQLIRWSNYFHRHTGKTAYGVYWTPQHVQLIAKNGILHPEYNDACIWKHAYHRALAVDQDTKTFQGLLDMGCDACNGLEKILSCYTPRTILRQAR